MGYGKNYLKSNIYVLYSVLFATVCFVVFLPFLLRGNGLVSAADGYNSAFPYFCYTREFWSSFLQGNPILFDYTMGLGSDPIGTIGIHGLFDLTQIATALLFPVSQAEAAYAVSIILKLYLAGVFFLSYMLRYVKHKELAAAGSLLYVFNAYVLFWGIYFPPLLVPYMMLPLILKGTDELINGNKNYLSRTMVTAVFLQGLNGYYFVYMIAIITALYTCIIVFLEKNEISFKDKIIRIIKTALNGALGIGLSGIVFLPMLSGFFLSTRTAGNQINWALIRSIDELTEFVSNLIVPNIYVSTDTVSSIVLAGCVFLFFQKKSWKGFKALSLFLLVLYLCPLWGSVMHGFSYSTDRWHFAVIFILTASAVIAMDAKEHITGKEKIVFLSIALLSMVVHAVSEERDLSLFLRIAVFTGLSCILPLIWNTSKRKTVLLYYSATSCIMMGLFIFGPRVLGGSGYSANFKANGVYDEILSSTKDLEDKEPDFERWDMYNSSFGASLIADYYGTAAYYSTLNANVSDFYREMMISPGIRTASFILKGLDGRREIEALLSVAQYMDYQTDKEERREVIKENDSFIPLGFTYDKYILKEDFDRLNPMEKSSRIMDSVVLEEVKPNYLRVDEKSNGYGNVELEYKAELTVPMERIRVDLPFEQYNMALHNNEGEVFVFLRDLYGDGNLYVGNKDVELKDASYLYYSGVSDYWINVSEIKKDQKGYFFEIKQEGITDFELSKMKIFWHPIDSRNIKERQENSLTELTVENNRISGKISTNKEELLFLSIPYGNGWKALVNEKESEIWKANIGFMAIPLEKGENSIILNYQPPGLKAGAWCTALSVVLLVLLNIGESKRNGRETS